MLIMLKTLKRYKESVFQEFQIDLDLHRRFSFYRCFSIFFSNFFLSNSTFRRQDFVLEDQIEMQLR